MHRISVLIVEDNPLAAKIAERLLREKNCLVDIAENGLAAIEKFERGHYQLIFMDIGLPDLTGFEVTQKIRKYEKNHRSQATVIIGLTASATEENLDLGLKSGMNKVLAKPLTIEMLNKILLRLTETKEVKRNALKKSKKLIERKSPDKIIIDLELGAKIFGGSEEKAKEMVKKLVNMLPEDLKKLQEAFLKKDYSKLKYLAHYIKGGTTFCGTPLLTEAATDLDNILKSQKTTQDIQSAYHHLCQEITSVLSEYNKMTHKN